MITTKRDTFKSATADVKKSAKKIARNTWRYTREDGTQVIRLHNTDVVMIAADGQVTFDSGGFRTITTKDRMNMNGRGYSVYSVKGSWHVRHGEQSVPFYDGVTLPRDFEALPKLKALQLGAAEKKLNADIRKFCALLLDTTKPIPKPDLGDCWLCLFGAKAVAQCGQPGDRTGGKVHDPAHLLEHIREGYMHGHLILNAMRWAGYRDGAIALVYSGHWDRKDIARTLRRFLKFQLGTGEAR